MVHIVIYAVVNTKGGVGKTTTAVHLSAMLARTGATLLIDGDPQASAASWAAWRREAGRTPSPTTTVLAGKAILTEGKSLSANYAHTVVDAGGRDSPGMRAALLLADRAIIPIGASNLDASALDDLMGIVEDALQFNERLVVNVLLTRIDLRTKDTSEMIEYLGQKGLQVLASKICERVSVRRAVGEGLTVLEVGKDISAIAEFDAFYKEVTT